MADVSVIIPCYNGRAYIGQTLDSVLAQTDRPAQVLVIDDGSTDDSAAIIEGYTQGCGGRVRLIRQANAGESRARNVGMQQATGSYVAFLDADDLWMPDKTRRQVEYLEANPQAIAAHSRVFNFKAQLEDCARAESERTKDNPGLEDLIDYHYICPSSLMVRRRVLVDRNVRFEEAVRHSEDMLFMADLQLAGPIRLIDEPLTAKRIHAGQQTRNPMHTIYSLESRANWCRDRAGQLGQERSQALLDQLGRKMIASLEDRYWRRQFEGYREARRRVAAQFPRLLAQSPVANRVIYPRWVYQLRDALSGSK